MTTGNSDIKRLTELSAHSGLGVPQSVVPVAAAASSRRYYRISYGRDEMPTLIGAIGKSAAENKAFVKIAACLEAEGIAAPRVRAVEPGYGAYIVTDLGDTTLMDLVTSASRSGEWTDSRALVALDRCMDMLPAFQYRVGRRLDASVCYPRQAMDRRSIMWDLNHFKYCFLKAAGAEVDEEGLENDFERLADIICAQADGPFTAFIHRDCQSRNVMMTGDDTPAWIDFQGGRIGPVAYDVASFVWHARAAFPEEIRRRLLSTYVAALRRETGVSVTDDEFYEILRPVLLLRLLQVLGAYGLRGITEGKAAFITPIPALVAEIGQLLPWVRSRGLGALAHAIESLRDLEPVKQASETRDSLIVTVMSFSYKRGLPRDFSGNGGGFIFDCRYPNNPGRYREYRHLTGRDRAVIDFLEADGEMPVLASRAIETVMAAAKRYRDRGFTHLSVAFGCTGGQHRSVYGAERMARALSEAGFKVHLIHREQGIDINL